MRSKPISAWSYAKPRQRLSGSEELRIGKEYEEYIANKLTGFGFSVTDISMRTYQNDDGSTHYYPFDLLAASPYYSLVIDVKYRRSKARVSISKYQADFQAAFKLDKDVDDRLLVFCTPGLGDSYISLFRLKAIDETSSQDIYLAYGYYVIERYAAESLSKLRKILEVAEYL